MAEMIFDTRSAKNGWNRSARQRGNRVPMKKYIILMLAAVMLLIGSVQLMTDQKQENITITRRFTFVCPLKWEDMAEGMKAADREFGTNTKFVGFQSLDAQGQANALQKAVYARVAGIITAGSNYSPLVTNAVNQAVKEGIPVVLVDSDLTGSERTCYIGTDNREAGRIAGEDLAEVSGQKAKIGIIVSRLDNQNQQERVEGFQEAIAAYPDMEIVEVLECESDRMRVQKLAEQMFKQYPQIDAVYCAEDVAPQMLGSVLKGMNSSPDDYRVVGHGLNEKIWGYIQEGRYYSTMVEEDHDRGYQAVSYLWNYINGRNTDVDVINTGVISAKKDFDFETWSNEHGAEEVVWDLS